MSTRFIRGIDNYRSDSDKPTLVTIGTFDGIHRGHQEILRRVSEESERDGYKPVLVTFHPHPRVLVTPDNVPLLLTTIEEKEQFVPHFFDGDVLVLEFDDALKELSAQEFVETVLVKTLNARRVIVGYDHAFGKNRTGNIAELTRLGGIHGFDVEVVGPIMHHDSAISSSRIRIALQDNRLGDAIEMLGHDYAIFGTVERGIGLGRRIGYPTANVRYNSRKLLPCEGVYSCWAGIGDESWSGMMFIGTNYFNPEHRVTVEANLFDFDRDIYDQEVVVYPTRYIRANKKFATTDALVAQLALDKNNIVEILKKEKINVDAQRAKSSNYR